MRFNEILVPATKYCSILLPIVLVSVPFAPILEEHAIISLVITCTPSMCIDLQSRSNMPADLRCSVVLLGCRQRLRRRHLGQVRTRSRQLFQNRGLEVYGYISRHFDGKHNPAITDR